MKIPQILLIFIPQQYFYLNLQYPDAKLSRYNTISVASLISNHPKSGL